MSEKIMDLATLEEFRARIGEAVTCTQAVVNGRSDGRHTLYLEDDRLECHLCDYVRSLGSLEQAILTMLAEVDRLRVRLQWTCGVCLENRNTEEHCVNCGASLHPNENTEVNDD